MVRRQEDIEAEIVRFLHGEASPKEAMELMEWRSADHDNEALFTTIDQLYHQLNALPGYREKSSEEVWQLVRNQLHVPTKVIPLWRRREVYLGAAAVAAIAFLIGFLWQAENAEHTNLADETNLEQPSTGATVYQANQHIASFELIDHSVVKLQPGSSLELAADFNKTERLLKLKGSGTFDVVHNDQRPFIVQVEKLKVQDIGTVFDVQTKGDTVKVVVSEGEVQLQLNGKVLNVAAGDSAFYVVSKDLIGRYKSQDSRQDHVFEFKGTKLQEVVSVLGEFFNRKIVIMNPEIADCQVSVTFKNENLTTILDIICELLDIKAIRNNEIIGLYGERCL